MLSWRDAAGNSGSVGRLLILLLLDNGRIVQGASSETMLDQKLMQLSQRRYGNPRPANRHSGTDGRIKHPTGNDNDHAGRRFDVNKLAASAVLGVVAANTPPIQGVPAVTNLNFLPDMGRMTARLRSTEKMRCSPAPTAVLSIGLSSPH
jgi:hypothetical protein